MGLAMLAMDNLLAKHYKQFIDRVEAGIMGHYLISMLLFLIKQFLTLITGATTLHCKASHYLNISENVTTFKR